MKIQSSNFNVTKKTISQNRFAVIPAAPSGLLLACPESFFGFQKVEATLCEDSLRDSRRAEPVPTCSGLAGMTTFRYLLAIAICFTASDAYAMHISEGLLPFQWAALWFVVAVPFVAFGLYQLKKASKADLSFKPLVGLMAAVVFIVSCMPVPVPTAGTCSHPCGTGLSAILLGPAISVVVASVALLIQALFLAHGGLTTWGADIVSMGVMGSFAGYFTFKGMRALKANLRIAGFMAGLFADWATYLTTSAELASGIKGDSPFLPLFWKILIAFIPTQLPLGILEGAMTAGMVTLLYKKRPDLLVKMRVLKPEEEAI